MTSLPPIACIAEPRILQLHRVRPTLAGLISDSSGAKFECLQAAFSKKPNNTSCWMSRKDGEHLLLC